MDQYSIIQLFSNFNHMRIINMAFSLFVTALLKYLCAMQFTHLFIYFEKCFC